MSTTRLNCTGDGKEVSEVINRISACAKGRTTLPALSCALLTIDGGKVYAVASDLDLWHRAPLPLSLDGLHEEGDICAVGLDALAALTARANGDGMLLTWRDGKLAVHAGKRKAEILTLPASEFPAGPKIPTGDWISLSGASVAKAMRGVQFAASTDTTRYVLNGIYVFDGEVVATNARMLAQVRIAPEALPGFNDVILPTKAISPAADFLERVEKIEVAAADDYGILFRANDEILFAKCIEGRYPNFKQVIPNNDQPVKVKIRRAELRDAMGWVKTMWAGTTFKGDRTVKVEIDEYVVRLSTFVPEKGESTETIELPAPAAKRAVFAVPFQNLIGMVSREGADEVSLETDPQNDGTVGSPILIRDGDDFLGMIMPMRVVDPRPATTKE